LREKLVEHLPRLLGLALLFAFDDQAQRWLFELRLIALSFKRGWLVSLPRVFQQRVKLLELAGFAQDLLGVDRKRFLLISQSIQDSLIRLLNFFSCNEKLLVHHPYLHLEVRSLFTELALIQSFSRLSARKIPNFLQQVRSLHLLKLQIAVK